MQIEQNQDYRWVVGFPHDPNSKEIEVDGIKFLAIPYSQNNHTRQMGSNLEDSMPFNTDEVEYPFDIKADASSDWNGGKDLYIHASTVFTERGGKHTVVNDQSFLAIDCKKPTALREKMLSDNIESVCSQLGLGHPYPMMLTTERNSLPILRTKAQIPSLTYNAYLIAIRSRQTALRR